jgi:hypothetical protein
MVLIPALVIVRFLGIELTEGTRVRAFFDDGVVENLDNGRPDQINASDLTNKSLLPWCA